MRCDINVDLKSLQALLSEIENDFHAERFLTSDPLEFAHRYSDPWDQEAVALISALLAYGNVKQIRRSLETLLAQISELEPRGPAAFVRGLGSAEKVAESRQRLRRFVHRFNSGADILLLFRLLERSWTDYGSLGAHFVSGLHSGDAHIGDALDRLMGDWRGWLRELRGHNRCKRDSFQYLLTAPTDGSCCKRWCMFLRWMGRSDRLDLGLWTETGRLAGTFSPGRFVRAHQLILPLDTHTGRISRWLGLTERKSANWKAAVEVTEALKGVDPLDPTRFDFALSRIGILGETARLKECEGWLRRGGSKRV